MLETDRKVSRTGAGESATGAGECAIGAGEEGPDAGLELTGARRAVIAGNDSPIGSIVEALGDKRHLLGVSVLGMGVGVGRLTVGVHGAGDTRRGDGASE